MQRPSLTFFSPTGITPNGLSAVHSSVAGNHEHTVRSTAAETGTELGLGSFSRHAKHQ
jgi:hypothetical protein